MDAHDSTKKYLFFHIDQELFATPLMEVREVVEKMPIKSMPNTKPYYKGVVNLRGRIVGVIDLMERIGMSKVDKNFDHECFLIFETDNGCVAIVVQKVLSVGEFSQDVIDEVPYKSKSVKDEYVMGVAKFHDQLATVVNFSKLLNDEDVVEASEQFVELESKAA